MDMVEAVVDNAIEMYIGELPNPEEWNVKGLIEYLERIFLPKDSVVISEDEKYDLTKEDLKERILKVAHEAYALREEENGEENMREAERVILLRVVDQKWMDHIDAMDQLRQGIGLRAYGQRDPVVEYRVEGYEMFEEMVRSIQEETVRILFNIKIHTDVPKREKVAEPVSASHGGSGPKRPVVKGQKVGRNDPCPCGSGKKYKRCCGA